MVQERKERNNHLFLQIKKHPRIMRIITIIIIIIITTFGLLELSISLFLIIDIKFRAGLLYLLLTNWEQLTTHSCNTFGSENFVSIKNFFNRQNSFGD